MRRMIGEKNYLKHDGKIFSKFDSQKKQLNQKN